MLSYQTVNSHTLELLKKLTNEEFLSKARLVGGTALALQYGHRISIDLDFFGNIKEVLINIGKLSVIKESKNIKIYILDDIKIDFVNYRYNWLDPAIEENGIRLASPRDIAAMKINAIEGRGTKKDFIDIYFLLQHYSLENILKFYADKYPDNSQFRALMSLTYSEEQFMPEMLVAIDWDRIKSFIIDKVATLSL